MFDTITDKIRNAGVSINDKELYAQVANEIARGTLDPGLWTKAFADSRGDKKQAEVLYIRMRVADIAAQRKRLEHHRQQETIRTETYRQIEGLKAQQQMLESALSNLETEYRRTPNGLGLALVFAAIAFIVVAVPMAYMLSFEMILGSAFMGAIAAVGGIVLSRAFGKRAKVRGKLYRTKSDLDQVRAHLSRLRDSL